jgi:hypothetical protein
MSQAVISQALSTVWELDYYSRPILDEDQKKRWEVVICQSPMATGTDAASLFRFTKYCPSTTVNSDWLAAAIAEAMAAAPVAPTQIRFFRRQMNNMITRACQNLGLEGRLSRRTVMLSQWLDQRYAEVYPQEPGYQVGATPSVQYGRDAIAALPDALQGDRWSLVTLPAAQFAEMAEWEVGFGEGFPLASLGLEPDQPIPGILIYSARALPLAAWMSGLELAFVKLSDGPPPNLVLETGASERWLLAPLSKAPLVEEAKRFEAAKAAAANVHFIGIPADESAERFAGFWVLRELQLG